jgi:HPt (histidine-containing phosphotransfer) domain-containing protein
MHRRPFSIPRHRRDEVGSGGFAAGAVTDGEAAPAIDGATFDRLRELDPDGQRGFLRQVLQTYERSLERQLGLLAEAAAAGEVARAGEVAHTLKSSSASIGALGLSGHCATVERLARGGSAEALGASLQALQAEAARVQAAVQAMLAG